MPKLPRRSYPELFPSFDDDFKVSGDIDELNDDGSIENEGENDASKSKKSSGSLTDFDPVVLSELIKRPHQNIVAGSYSAGSWKPTEMSPSEHEDALLLLTKETQHICLLIFGALNNSSSNNEGNKYELPMDTRVDSNLTNSTCHVTLAIEQLQASSVSTFSSNSANQKAAKSKRTVIGTSERPYNFYKDPNTIEGEKIPKVLDPLSQRINQLLEAWPEPSSLVPNTGTH